VRTSRSLGTHRSPRISALPDAPSRAVARASLALENHAFVARRAAVTDLAADAMLGRNSLAAVAAGGELALSRRASSAISDASCSSGRSAMSSRFQRRLASAGSCVPDVHSTVGRRSSTVSAVTRAITPSSPPTAISATCGVTLTASPERSAWTRAAFRSTRVKPRRAGNFAPFLPTLASPGPAERLIARGEWAGLVSGG
jgi:hypothetical protein